MAYEEIEIITKNLEISYGEFCREQSENNRKQLLNSLLKICYFYAKEGNLEAFEKTFIQIRNLENQMLTEKTSICLAECFFRLTSILKGKIMQYPEILDDIFTLMLDLRINTPCREYTLLYKSVHKFRKVWNGYVDFCRWWNLENFLEEDFIIDKSSKMSLAESALIFYSKRLTNTQFEEDVAKLALTFINAKQKYNLTVYSNYYIVKLLLQLKFDNNQIRSVLKPFIAVKPFKPWGWHLMSKTFSVINNFNEKYACLLLALNFGKEFNDGILNGIYLDLSLMFKDLNKYANSKFFLEIFLSIKARYGHKIPDFVIKITRESWYKSVSSERPNTHFDYKEVCREIYRQTKDVDSVLLNEISAKLENDFNETLQWSKDWYETM